MYAGAIPTLLSVANAAGHLQKKHVAHKTNAGSDKHSRFGPGRFSLFVGVLDIFFHHLFIVHRKLSEEGAGQKQFRTHGGRVGNPAWIRMW
jgi:hypothetical protein